MAYLSLEPIGEERADLRSGIVASVIANANRKKGTRAFKPDDFMPKFGRQQELSDEELETKLGQLARAYGGTTGKLSEL